MVCHSPEGVSWLQIAIYNPMKRLALFLLFLLSCQPAWGNVYSESFAANDTNILASTDVNNSSNSSDHQHLNVSYGTSGGWSGGASADRSRGSSDGITNHNSALTASNINIHTKDRTAIAGANIHASDSLNIHTKHLDVASMQDSNNGEFKSQVHQ